MIYFIQAGKYVKIGYSKDPSQRLKELQTSNPVKLKLLAILPGWYTTEAEFHRVFARFRVNREWFRYDGHLKWCIIAINDAGTKHTVTDIRSLQQAGCNLQMRQKLNRKNSRGV